MSGASAQAIRHHYDVGDSFYRLFLDGSLTYSCALFEEADTLEAAQARKMDWHVAQARAAATARVLDVGCGWGSLLRRLTTVHGVRGAVGLTLSTAQHAYVAEASDPGVEVRLEGWTEHAPDMPYDAIISVGAFEHFARLGIPAAEKVAAYRRFFQRCHDWLQPGGRVSLQTIAYGDIPRDRIFTSPFFATEIFPESDPPRLADIAEACEQTFEIIALRNDREHYARTCRLWFNRLRARRAEATVLVGQDIVARYERYLRTFSLSFELGAFQLLRIGMRRLDMRRPKRAPES